MENDTAVNAADSADPVRASAKSEAADNLPASAVTLHKDEDSGSFTVEELESPIMAQFASMQKSFRDGFIRYNGYIMPRSFLQYEERIRNFEVREDDIWIATFPKCGTTWTQEMVWNIVHHVDLDTAKAVSLEKRAPFLEFSSLMEKHRMDGLARIPGTDISDTVEQANQLASPRIIKTHLPVEILPKQVLTKAKLICVTRNPRDVILSYYNHWKIWDGYSGDLDSFIDAFLEDINGYYTPFIPHVLGYWNLRDRENVLFFSYEDMQHDLPAVIRKVTSFLKKELSENQISLLSEHLDFKRMRDNPAVNKASSIDALKQILKINSEDVKFMRKGMAGNWRKEMTRYQVDRIRDWEQRHLAHTGLSFQYE